MTHDDAPVRCRRMFYIPGYDPFHPRRYRELYRREGRAQAALSGYRLAVRPRAGAGYGWFVQAEIDGARTVTEVEVLVWSDIVAASMAQGTLATYAQMLGALRAYVASGVVFRLARLRAGPVLAGLYPVGMLVLYAVLSLALGRAAQVALAAAVPAVAASVLGLGVAGAALAAFRRLDRHLLVFYLMHDLAFTAQAGGAYPPALEARLADFRQRVQAALAAGADEVLVVGHSTGAQLGVSVVADVLRAGPPGGRLALLTLGQSVPMASFLPRADRLRGDLRRLAGEPAITWVDVSAPGDGCAFALCDPVAVTGVAPPGKRWPLVLSCAFRRTLRPETWRRLRYRFFRLHFQYLCAFDAPGLGASDYDYFNITAGTRSLAARYAGRAPSRSRIETPASRHTAFAA